MPKDLIKIDNISKSFVVGEQTIQVLHNISFDVKDGDFMVIFGPSGCGKSTLLHTVLGLEPPSDGKIIFDNKDIYKEYDEDGRSEFRKRHIGMVYQQPNWIKSLTVVENVAFPLILMGKDRYESIKKAREILDTLKMADWGDHIPMQLSSGQQQRIALLRAIISEPQAIIADEPTGNLDYESGQQLMDLLRYYNKEENRTIIAVTHDLEYLKFCKSAIKMLDGRVIDVFSESLNNVDNLQSQVKSKRGLNFGDSRLKSVKNSKDLSLYGGESSEQ